MNEYADWQASIIQEKITALIGWFNKRNARVMGNFDGQIILALDDKDFAEMREEIFTEGNNETSEEEGKTE